MYSNIRIPDPSFDSTITRIITELEKLRNEDNIIYGGFREVGVSIFIGLKNIFQTVESLASARIEGNRTTISEYIDRKNIVNHDIKKQQKQMEIRNIYMGIDFIDKFKENGRPLVINHTFFSQLHQILMKDLVVGDGFEGDDTPGSYRKYNVSISKSDHIVPDYTQVQNHMDELIDFIENYKKGQNQYDLLKIAIAHHRFVRIHPYGNGNGRMVRILTYAMLIKYGFDVGNLGLLNPSTLFCLEREKYYDYLNNADKGTNEGLLGWCEYAIGGIYNETQKLELLGKKSFVIDKILSNAIKYIQNKGIIDENESKILKVLYNKSTISAKDLKSEVKLHPVTISSKFKHLKKIGLITPQTDKKTIYRAIFKNDEIFKAIFYELAHNGFDTWLDLDKIS